MSLQQIQVWEGETVAFISYSALITKLGSAKRDECYKFFCFV